MKHLQKQREISRNSHKYYFQLASNESTEFLVISDVHYDSLKCDRKLLKKHLDEAKEKDAGIIIAGDLFDIMGSERDPRSKANQIRSEYIVQGMSYLNCVIDDIESFLRPYADNLMVLGMGNHETKIQKHNEIDPLYTLVHLLNKESEREIYKGGYSGYVIFKFKRYEGNHQSRVLKYHHGHGGSAHRSKGMLDVDIDAAKWPDADIIVKGHDHNRWKTTKMREKLNNQHNTYESAQHHIRLGSYKKLGDGFDGWSTEKGHEPKPRGGWWISFRMDNRTVKTTITEAN